MKANALPSSWRNTTLGEIAASVPNAIVDGPFGSNLKLSDYVEEGVPVLQGKNITNDSFRWFDVRFISDRKATELKRSSVRVGDILIIKIGSIGYSAIVEDLNGFEFAIIPANLAKVTPDSTKVDLIYLHKWLTSVDAKRYLNSVASKTAQPALSLGKIKSLPLPLPPLAEQRRLAEVLDRAEALRAKRRAALAQLDPLTQSLFLDLFGDPIFNPKRIPKRPLGEMIRVKSGDSVLVSELSDSGEFPVYGGNGINGYHTRFMFESPIIVIGRVGVYCGVVHITKPNAWVTDNALFVTDISPELELPYLAQALTIANLNQYAGRAAQPLVSGSRIYPVEILVPPIPLQREFARRVTAVEALKTAQRASLAELDALFATLQHRAFRGEL